MDPQVQSTARYERTCGSQTSCLGEWSHGYEFIMWEKDYYTNKNKVIDSFLSTVLSQKERDKINHEQSNY